MKILNSFSSKENRTRNCRVYSRTLVPLRHDVLKFIINTIETYTVALLRFSLDIFNGCEYTLREAVGRRVLNTALYRAASEAGRAWWPLLLYQARRTVEELRVAAVWPVYLYGDIKINIFEKSLKYFNFI